MRCARCSVRACTRPKSLWSAAAPAQMHGHSCALMSSHCPSCAHHKPRPALPASAIAGARRGSAARAAALRDIALANGLEFDLDATIPEASQPAKSRNSTRLRLTRTLKSPSRRREPATGRDHPPAGSDLVHTAGTTRASVFDYDLDPPQPPTPDVPSPHSVWPSDRCSSPSLPGRAPARRPCGWHPTPMVAESVRLPLRVSPVVFLRRRSCSDRPGR